MTPPKVSLVIATMGRPDRLRWVLESLLRQDEKSFEVKVVNDGGCSKTEELVQTYRGRLELEHLWADPRKQAYRGAARARNVGISYCQAPRLLVIDDDCLCPPSVISSHAKFGEQAIVVAGLRRHVQPQHQHHVPHRLDRIEELFSRPDYREETNRVAVLERYCLTGDIAVWPHIYTCHCSYPTAAVVALGGYWEDLAGAWAEDGELALRLLRGGARAHLLRQPYVYHLDHVASGQQLQYRDRNTGMVHHANHHEPPILIRNGGALPSKYFVYAGARPPFEQVVEEPVQPVVQPQLPPQPKHGLRFLPGQEPFWPKYHALSVAYGFHPPRDRDYAVFLRSWAAAKPQGRLVLFTGDLSPFAEGLTREIAADVLQAPVALNDPGNVNRHYLFLEYLLKLPPRDRVILVDARDTVVQSDPFEILNEELGDDWSVPLFAPEGVRSSEEAWNLRDRQQLLPTLRHEARNRYVDWHVINGGFVAGEARTIALLELSRLAMDSTDRPVTDQTTLQWLAQRLADAKFAKLAFPRESRFVFHGHHEPSQRATISVSRDDGRSIIRATGKAHAFFHQWDRVPQVSGLLRAKYGG